MKKTVLLSGLLLCAISSIAQTHPINPLTKKAPNKHSSFINGLMSHQAGQMSGIAQKPTGIQQRILAQALRWDEEGSVDSTKYSFSGTRTSRYNHNSEELNYNTGFDSDYLPGGILPASSRSFDLQADSIKSYYEPGPAAYMYKAFYRSDNKMDSFYTMYSMGPTYNTTKTLHVFNNNGYLTQATELDGPSFDTVYVHRYHYNSSGDKLLSDTLYDYTMGNLLPFTYTLYNYNTSNLLDTIAEYESYGVTDSIRSKIYLTYETGATPRIKGVHTFNYDSDPMWNNGYADSFGYTGASTIYTFYQSYYLNASGNIDDGNRTIKKLGTNNLPDSLYGYYAETFGMWEPVGNGKYYYNSFNNPDSLVINIEEEGETIKSKYSFYYETYDDGNSVGIKDPKANKNFNIYPNPFDNKINIDWKGAESQAKIRLINMLGQTIYSLNRSLSTGNNVLDIPATTGGNYILMIQDEKGSTYSQKLTKR